MKNSDIFNLMKFFELISLRGQSVNPFPPAITLNYSAFCMHREFTFDSRKKQQLFPYGARIEILNIIYTSFALQMDDVKTRRR